MWFVMNNIDSRSIEQELIMFIYIRVLRLRSTDWKSSFFKGQPTKCLLNILTSVFLCVCPVIDHELRHKIVNVIWFYQLG